MQVCVIGDSHLAALKLGWPAVQGEFPDIQLVFFGAPHPHMNDLEFCDGNLVASTTELRQFLQQTSEGRPEIDSQYDRYLVYGLQFSIRRALEPYRAFRAESHQVDDRTPISDECFFRAMIGCLREAPAIGVLAKLRQLSDAPISLTPNPMPSDADPAPEWEHLRMTGDDRSVSERYRLAVQELANEFGAEVVYQPAGTLRSPLNTMDVYSRDSVRLYGELKLKHPPNEYNHMNAAFGAIMLREALSSLIHPAR